MCIIESFLSQCNILVVIILDIFVKIIIQFVARSMKPFNTSFSATSLNFVFLGRWGGISFSRESLKILNISDLVVLRKFEADWEIHYWYSSGTCHWNYIPNLDVNGSKHHHIGSWVEVFLFENCEFCGFFCVLNVSKACFA